MNRVCSFDILITIYPLEILEFHARYLLNWKLTYTHVMLIHNNNFLHKTYYDSSK
jgi:hypothetical protein